MDRIQLQTGTCILPSFACSFLLLCGNNRFPDNPDIIIFNTLHVFPDGNTATGKRNRCIILCFTEFALRCSEVAALTLDDFNWCDGYVTVCNKKNSFDRILPLPKMMGNSLVEYLV